jgi:cytoskeletal protein CcmA (bactofilin family)
MLFRRRQSGASPAEAALVPPALRDPIAPSGGGRTVIGPQTRIRGKLRGDGPMMIRGAVTGEIALRGALTVAETGQVDADVEAQTVDLLGEIRGTMRASARVAMTETGTFEGEMTTPVLEVRPGSIVRGRARVAGPALPGRDDLSH